MKCQRRCTRWKQTFPPTMGLQPPGILTAVSACRNILPLSSGKKDSGLGHLLCGTHTPSAIIITALSLIPRWPSMIHGTAEFVEKTQKKSGRRIKHSRLWFVRKKKVLVLRRITLASIRKAAAVREKGLNKVTLVLIAGLTLLIKKNVDFCQWCLHALGEWWRYNLTHSSWKISCDFSSEMHPSCRASNRGRSVSASANRLPLWEILRQERPSLQAALKCKQRTLWLKNRKML